VLKRELVGPNENFFDSGGDSLRAMELAATIERTLNIKLHWTVILRAPTPAQLARLLECPDTDLSRQTLRSLHDGEKERNFILVNGAAANRRPVEPGDKRRLVARNHGRQSGDPRRTKDSDRLNQLAESLGPSVGLYCFDYGSDEIRIDVLAQDLVREIRRVQAVGPYFMGGFCYGGVVAYEAARLLFQRGDQVAVLAILDASGPGYPRPITSRRDRIRSRLRRLWAQPLSDWPRYLIERFRGLAARAWIQLNSRIRKKSEQPVSLYSAHRAQLDAYFAKIGRYPGRVLLARATKIKYLSSIVTYDDTTNGWGSVADGGVTTIPVPGDHSSILEPPNITAIGRAIRSAIEWSRSP
jgi:aspartate racemase